MTERTEQGYQSTGQDAFHTRAPDSRRTRKPEEVGKILGIGRNQVYELIRSRELRSISVGRKLLVPLTAIDEFLAGQVGAN
ncbi:helix-turn-helix domain-containing protein [Deinococcus sp.]|uniref:helix-turn-helix domain-containing protein n=1 Tax=Deinococcus sp. TaxID=47478 RepID=UPI003C7A9CDD